MSNTITFSKRQAQAVANAYSAGLPGRIDAALSAAAAFGQVGGVFSFIVATDADTAVAQLQAAGWVVARDDVAKVLTVTPV